MADREADRERVMKELSWLIFIFPQQKNPRTDTDRLCNAINAYCIDAFDLLKAQEPRVLSWEEVDKSGNSYVWAEVRSLMVQRNCLIYCTVQKSKFNEWLYKLREDSGIDWTRTEEDYNRDNYQGAHSGWRCWSARPTEEQRKAVLWDG